ncbi:MAG: peptidoglycan-associated lipoprotein Pal [Syntrophales bacterium]|nr:peptidoglycan-associated lipoprotein Pal [Syntrophales bacterium]
MKRSWGWVGLMALVLCLSVSWMTGCAKKATLQEGAVVTQEQKAVAQAPAEAAATSEADSRAARDRAMRDQALSDQAAREAAEKAAMEAAAKAAKEAAKEAADRAKKEAAAKAAAILKELQIADVNFDYNKYNLKPEAQEILKKGAPAYLKYRDYKLVVEGHCDERGTAEYNLALGDKRATEAAKYLADLGVEKERIKTISYGKEMPLDQGHDEAAWAKNRRAHFVIFPPVK